MSESSLSRRGFLAGIGLAVASPNIARGCCCRGRRRACVGAVSGSGSIAVPTTGWEIFRVERGSGYDDILVPLHGAWTITWDQPNFNGNYSVYYLPFRPPNPAPISREAHWRFDDYYRRIHSLKMGPHADIAIGYPMAIVIPRFGPNESWASFPPPAWTRSMRSRIPTESSLLICGITDRI